MISKEKYAWFSFKAACCNRSCLYLTPSGDKVIVTYVTDSPEDDGFYKFEDKVYVGKVTKWIATYEASHRASHLGTSDFSWPMRHPIGEHQQDAETDVDVDGDVDIVMTQVKTTREAAIAALDNNKGDIVNAILELMDNDHNP
jgi:NACalpha-BTF3-like transcription factor